MCAFKRASNELLRSFHEQCVHLMILFQGLSKAHLLHITDIYVIYGLVYANREVSVNYVILHANMSQ